MAEGMNRRKFLQTSAAAALTLAAPALPFGKSAAKTRRAERFTFIHFTDTHVQPELRAGEGLHQCIEVMNRVGADFAIHGGDIVFDVFKTDRKRAHRLYDLYLRELKHFKAPTHHVIGNHDVFGVDPASGVARSDPQYAKRMFEEYLGEGRTYRSFDHGRWHFILLDSIDITSDRSYRGLIDYEQMEWLQEDLQKTGRERPVVIVTHIPLLTLFWQIIDNHGAPLSPHVALTNAKKVWDLIEPYNVKAVLQGHLHIIEKMEYNGTQYITSGAVCGNWWKGPRMGHPEGFAVCEVEGDNISWRYETYGWKAEVGGE